MSCTSAPVRESALVEDDQADTAPRATIFDGIQQLAHPVAGQHRLCRAVYGDQAQTFQSGLDLVRHRRIRRDRDYPGIQAAEKRRDELQPGLEHQSVVGHLRDERPERIV